MLPDALAVPDEQRGGATGDVREPQPRARMLPPIEINVSRYPEFSSSEDDGDSDLESSDDDGLADFIVSLYSDQDDAEDDTADSDDSL